MIDTHCHLDLKDYPDLEDVILKMEGNYMIASGYDIDSSKHVLELIKNMIIFMELLAYIRQIQKNTN